MAALLVLCGCLSAKPGVAPEARLDAPDVAVRGQPVALDGMESAGIVVQYRFDFGDGAAVEITAAPQTQHVYSALGPVNACLTVVSDTGKESGAACHRISVVEEMPDAGVSDAPVDAPTDGAVDAAVDG